jgi:multidrug resistance efflux pump
VIYLSGPRELIDVADARVQQSQSALEVAQATLAQGLLLAPYDGTVVQVNIAPGEYIQPGQVISVIGNLDHLQVETTDLSERDIPNVKLGQIALVHVKALDAEFSGKVTAISPIADIVGGDVVYKVTVSLDEQPEGLLWGMNAEVEINTEQ